MRTREEILDQLVIAAEQNTKERDYWLKQLSGDLVKSSFPYDYKESAPGELYEGNHTLNFNITGDPFLKLIKLSNASDHMLHMILVAGWVVLLDRYTFEGNGDIIVGSPIYRQEDETKSRLINTVLPLRHRLTPGMTFKELLLQVREIIVKATEHYSYPMEILPEQLGLESSGADFLLFDVAILVENIHEKSDLEHLPLGMTISFLRTGENIHGKLEYNRGLYRKCTVELIIKHFLYLMARVLSEVNQEIRVLSILSPEEKNHILYEFNATEKEYPVFPEETIQFWFERQVLQTPDQAALEYAGKELTYHQLNQQANRLAYYLRSKGVKPHGVVGIMISPCIEMIVGILGILKAGGTYLPIDPTYPQKRILQILNDSGATLLLTKNKELDKLVFTTFKQLRAEKITPLCTTPRGQIKPFERLPIPDRSLVNYERYHRWIGIAMGKYTVSIQATRGCPFNCAYCHKLWPKSHVTRSAENIFREILYCREAGIRRIVFIDDIFNLDIKNAARLLELIINHELDLQLFFPNGLRGDILTTDFIDLLMAAGTVNIGLALESSSRRIQQLIGKNLDLEKFTRNVQYITEKYPQLLLEMELLLGFPTETEEEARQTLDFVKEQQWIHFPYLNLLKIYPNTDMYRLAVEHGISETAIRESMDLAFHELPETLPYAKAFIRQEQTRFMNEYFLSQKRLLHVLPHQMKSLTEEELIQKYNSYLPADIKRFDDILELAGVSRQELGKTCFLKEECVAPPGFYSNFKPSHTGIERPDAFRVLLLDLSQFFSSHSKGMLYDMVEEPLGLMYLLTYLKDKFRDRVWGKIAKSRIDFDNYNHLKALIIDFKPDLIGIRTLSFYKDFFHRTVSLIWQWGIDVPIIAGGPYATSDYGTLLQDPNIDLAVLGEGELTLEVLVERMLENNKKLPGQETLKQVKGIAFIAEKDKIRLKQRNREIIFIDNLAETLDHFPMENPPPVNQSQDLLYLISTSGSTGEPKSVMLEHRNLMNLLKFEFSEMGIDFNRNILQFASIGFDVSAQEIFSALLSGGKLWLMDRDLKGDVLRLFDFIRENKISMVFWPPAFLKLVFSETMYIEAFPGTITHIIAAGEQLIVPQSLKEYLAANRVYLVNNYGPSETHVVTSLTIDPEGNIPGRPSIGKPISNTAIYILDKKKNIQPIGVIGELFIAGANVGRGYLDRIELTAERFLHMSYMSHMSYIYKTGDLARWLPNGNIEFIGRADHQVQIRGYRVELGEIEKRLKEIEYIKEALVLEKGTEIPGRNNYMCAYVVSEKKIDISELRTILSKSLPDFMIPAYFNQISGIPLTTNGKVDRKALPEPETTGSRDVYIAPENEIEETLQSIWSALLDVEKHRISVTANFFQLGGNSLKATIMISKVHKAFNLRITLGEMFKKPTIRGLSEYINARIGENRFTFIKSVEHKEYYILSSCQKRLYILQQMDNAGTVYNISSAWQLKGALKRNKLEQTFRKLIQRHESLRTSFEVVGGKLVQRVNKEVEFEIEYHQPLVGTKDRSPLNCQGRGEVFSPVEIGTIIAGFIRPFDLSLAPLLRVGLIKTREQEHFLMVDMHHIISDGISTSIFVKEFNLLYRDGKLPAAKVHYKDYVEWQRRIAGSKKGKEVLRQQAAYWREQFKGGIPSMNLRIDYPRTADSSFEGGSVDFEIGIEKTRALNQIALKEETTLYTVLLAITNILLSKITNQQVIILGTALAGRSHEDLRPVTGVFVNTLALINYLSWDYTFVEFLKDVKKRTLAAFENQDYPFDELVKHVAGNRSTHLNPIFDVMFALQNMDVFELNMNDLTISHFDPGIKHSGFDLAIVASEKKQTLRFSFEYFSKLFKKETIKRYTRYYKEIVTAVLPDGCIRLKDIKLSHRLLSMKPKNKQVEFGF